MNRTKRLLVIGAEGCFGRVDRLITGSNPPPGLPGRRRGKPGPILVTPRTVVTRQSSDVIAIEDADLSPAVRFIRDHAGESVGVKNLLLEAPLSRRMMELRFVKVLGRTLKAEFARVRIDNAKSILAAADSPMHVVARAAGFICRSPSATFFRHQTGLTPTQYRRAGRLGGIHRLLSLRDNVIPAARGGRGRYPQASCRWIKC